MIVLKMTFLTLIIFGILYPLFITGIAKLVAPNGGKGEEITVNGRVVGFELIGQKFDDDRYFNSRPSAVDYNAASTGGSNKGPTNPDYLAQVQARVDTFLLHNPSMKKEAIPVDLVTASGGGLDPHISPVLCPVLELISTRTMQQNRDRLKILLKQVPVLSYQKRKISGSMPGCSDLLTPMRAPYQKITWLIRDPLRLNMCRTIFPA